MAYLALDLGAGSGRAIIGTVIDGKLTLEEIHRFENRQVQLGETLYWDFLALFANIKQGIYKAVRNGYDLKGIAVDTWGVDFGLLDQDGLLLSNPVCYRDKRTQNTLNEVYSKYISKEKLYEVTGIQLMEINTAFQLYAMHRTSKTQLASSQKLLFTPDLINYFLTGESFNEYTIASTSQLLDAAKKEWATSLFDQLKLPASMMQEIIHPGDVVGKLCDSLIEETGAKNAQVFAVGSHDTASAIGAIPDSSDDWAFLSSGTWSLLGVLTDKPILTTEAMQADFTNEGGINNKILFMRNITGLWLLQNLLAEWERAEGKTYSYEYILSEAEKASAFQSIVNSDASDFSNPSSMTAAIQMYCKNTKQVVPTSKGELIRCVLESLAIKYAFVLRKLKDCSAKKVNKLYVVGGGSQNRLLNQFTANSLGIEVITGLTESTAIGNIMQQAIADQTVKNWQEGHQIIKNSFTFETFKPQDTQIWESEIERVKYLFE